MMKDQFWEMVDKLPVRASIPSESTGEEDHHQYMCLFNDHLKGKDHRSVLRMKIETRELSWFDLRF